MRLNSFLAALAFMAAAVQASAAGLDQRQRVAIDELLESTAAAAHLPSLVVLIDQGGIAQYQKAIGRGTRA
jgi:hypothetical protein